MAVRLSSGRSKSTSDILDKISYEGEMSEANSFHIENKYRPYTFDDLSEEEKCISNINPEHKKEHSSQKPRNFVKKLIASLEKKNEACKADDEFLAKYYNRNNYLNPNSDYSTDSKLRFSQNMKKFNHDKFILNSYVEANRAHSDDYKQNANTESDAFLNTQTSVFPNEKSIKQSTSIKPLLGCWNKQRNQIGIVNSQNKKYYSRNYVQYGLKKDVAHVNVNNDKRDHNDSSSFDPNRSRVQLENQTDAENSYSFKRNKDNAKTRSFEKVFISFEEEDTLKTSSMKKKVYRKKSFKDFLGSIIRWKKSEKREKPWRYMSCDHLVTQQNGFDSKDDRKLSRTMSFQTMVFQDCGVGNVSPITERKATIRPIYGGKGYKHRLELYAKKTEDRNFCVVKDNVNDLLKPPIIQGM